MTDEPRRRGRPRGPTAQAAETRALLYETATRLFDERGYEATTMRAIAREAGVSPGLLYRYFPSKSAVVVELYDALSRRFASAASELPGAAWPERFRAALDLSLTTLEPHREVLRALLGTLVADREQGLFGTATTASRTRIVAVFEQTIGGGTRDRHLAPIRSELGTLFYLVHMAVLLFWLLDASEAQRATARLCSLLERTLPWLDRALLIPPVRGLARELATTLRAGLLAG